MTTTVEALRELSRPPTRGRRPVWTAMRWLTLAALVATLLAFIGFGTRMTDYDRLEAGLASGSVTSVRVENWTGGPSNVDAGSYGTTPLRLVWRDVLLRRSTEVTQASSPAAAKEFVTDPSTPVVVGPVTTALLTLNPDVDITWGDLAGSSGFLSGWQLLGPWSLLVLLPLLLVLFVVAFGPEPALATPWAWFWLLVFSPVALYAAPVYLLWAARGYRGGRRLTGGWAFLLAWVVLPNLPWG